MFTPAYHNLGLRGRGDVPGYNLDMRMFRNRGRKSSYSKDFFGKSTNLTVFRSAHVETYAMAYFQGYTFGLTFRLKTQHAAHAANSWMIEPEIAFANLRTIWSLARSMLKSVVGLYSEEMPRRK